MKEVTMSGPIVFGVDDSPGARVAATVAMAIRRRIDAPLIFVHVVPDERTLLHGDGWSPRHLRRLALERGSEILDRVTSSGGRDRDAVLRLRVGSPAEQLTAVATAEGADMLVVGSRRRGALTAALLGSVSRELVVLSPCPVLVVPPDAVAPSARRHRHRLAPASVLCGIDGSPESQYAAEVASRLAGRLNDRLVLAHSYRPATTWTDAGFTRQYSAGPLMSQWRAGLKRLETAAAALNDSPEPGLSLEPGDPAEELIRMATHERSELLVVGSHGQGKLQAAFHGSVAATVASSAPIPVLIVPPPSDMRGVSANGAASIESDRLPESPVRSSRLPPKDGAVSE